MPAAWRSSFGRLGSRLVCRIPLLYQYTWSCRWALRAFPDACSPACLWSCPPAVVTVTVQIYACQLARGQVDFNELQCDLDTSHLTEYTLNLGTGEASARQLSHVSSDFPMVHPDRVRAMD